jgi:outer membrane protein assembly factor BamD (BamD/ComL family)
MRVSLAKCCVLAALAVAGCRSQSRSPTDPFAAQSQPPAAGVAQQNQNAPDKATGVQQASFQRPEYVPLPGKSIVGLLPKDEDGIAINEEKSAWEKTVENLAPSKVGKRFKKAIGRGPHEQIARENFDKGEDLFKQRKYDEAVKYFKEASKRWPDSGLEEDALFYLAESYFFADRYYRASDTYVLLLKKYENSRYLNDVVIRQFAIAQYWEQMAKDHAWYALNLTDKTRPYFDPAGNAIAVYNSVRLNDLNGPLSDDATMAMANYYFVHNRFEDAAYHYDLIRKEHPNSEHQLQAHLLGIRSKLRSYQGPQYEAAPLTEAEELIEKTLTTFPRDQLKEDHARLVQAREAIRFERGQRVFQSGEYYYKIKYYRAAQHYYREVIKDYPDTPFGKMALERITEVKDLPPVPPDYFKWLTKLFPTDGARR